MNETTEIRIEQILGRELLGGNNQRIGRIEEFRAQINSDGCVVHEVVIGMPGLLERMDVGARLVTGAEPKANRVARFDHIDFTNPAKPRLLVDVESLNKV